MAKYLINYLDRKSHIHRNIYGHFCEHLGRLVYDGIWVGKESSIPNIGGVRKDIVEALRRIRVPVIRWPGGCFADIYNWKDGIGPMCERKPVINHVWGKTCEDNSFGTNEFMDFTEAVGAEAYVNGNLGSGSIRDMMDWVEYISDDSESYMAQLRRKNGREKPWKLAAFGIGNEVWGGGGMMRPEYYADQFRQAAHLLDTITGGGLMEIFGGEPQYKTMMIASGPDGADYHFTDKFMEGITKEHIPVFEASGIFMADGMSLHYYARPSSDNPLEGLANQKTAADFDEYDWYDVLKQGAFMDELITRHDQIMSKYDPQKKVGLMVDEWGSWYSPEPGTNPAHLYQQNTVRDAVLAGMTLNIFNKHSDRVKLAALAQMVNVLQAVILTKDDQMILTPTYHIFDMYKGHQDATLLGTYIENKTVGTGDACLDGIFESCSVDEDGNMLCTLCNTSIDTGETINATIFGTTLKRAEAEILSGDPHAMNTFDNPDTVTVRPWTVKLTADGFSVELPAASVVSLKLIKGN